MSFDSKINNWIKSLSKGNVDRIFRRAIVENQELILDLNVAQLEIGLDSLGELLDDYFSDEYAQFKIALGSKAPFGTPNLILEGDFTEGFVLRVDGRDFFITSTDEKKDRLRDKYGDDIFGLMEKSLEELRPVILDTFLIIFRDGLLR